MKSATTKLTLALDSNAIRKAKEYAKMHNKSVSQIVEEYFVRLNAGNSTTARAETLPPKTRHLMGILKGHAGPDFTDEIGSYIQRKYR